MIIIIIISIIIIIIIIIIVVGYIRTCLVISVLVGFVRTLVGYIRNGWLYQTLYKNIVNLDSKYLTLQTLGKRYQ